MKPKDFSLFAALLAAVLLCLFSRTFDSSYTFFSNDGPLGQVSSDQANPAQQLAGEWDDLNWLGTQGVGAQPSVTTALRWLTYHTQPGDPWSIGAFLCVAAAFTGLCIVREITRPYVVEPLPPGGWPLTAAEQREVVVARWVVGGMFAIGVIASILHVP